MLKLVLNLSGYTKSGIKLSRFFRRVFESQNLKKVFGTNLALMVFATQLLPVSASFAEAEQTVINENEIQITTKKTVQYPLATVKINQGYTLFHPALDIDGVTGDEVRPVKDGVVEAVSYSRYAYGNAVIVNHGNGYTSLYAHLSTVLVFEGKEVTTLDTIGQVGSTGHSTGPHLHLEIRKGGIPINPFSVLSYPASPVI